LTTFEYLGAYYSRGVVLGNDRRVTARFVTPELLRLTEIDPLIGRLPDESDALPGAEPVVLLPHDLWSASFGGDPGLVGSRIEIAGVDRTVTGVTPPDFAVPVGHEIWIPIDPRDETERLQTIGKLREGAWTWQRQRRSWRLSRVRIPLGSLLGVLIGFGLLRLATIFPWRLGAGNPLILAIVPAVLGFAVLLALAGPLTRALSIRPADALRHE
jgi:hypothetical protein